MINDISLLNHDITPFQYGDLHHSTCWCGYGATVLMTRRDRKRFWKWQRNVNTTTPGSEEVCDGMD